MHHVSITNGIGPSTFPSKDLENFDHSLGKEEQYRNTFHCTKNNLKANSAACHQTVPPKSQTVPPKSCIYQLGLEGVCPPICPLEPGEVVSSTLCCLVLSADLLHPGLK